MSQSAFDNPGEPVEDDAQPSKIGRYHDAIVRHVELCVGPIDDLLTNPDSPLSPIQVLLVKATAERPYHVLVTSGLSDYTMPSPTPGWELAELCLFLPASWPVDCEQLREEENYWPVRWLFLLAEMPHEQKRWLCYGHSVPNGDPPQPLAEGTDMVAWVLMPCVSLPKVFTRLRLSDENVLNFWSLVPLHRDETFLKVNKGTPALLEKFGQQGISDILNAQRASVFARHRFGVGRWIAGT
jgi:hypothetical protein